jgi:Xaa-Pro aminopeptidase
MFRPPPPFSVLVKRAREELAARDLWGLVVPTADAHLSEYVAPFFQRVRKLSGFGGSVATALLTRGGGAYLWTDSRYWIEAAGNFETLRARDGVSPADWQAWAAAAGAAPAPPVEAGATTGASKASGPPPHWVLMRDGDPAVPTLPAYLARHMPPGARVGVDAATMSAAQWRLWTETNGVNLAALDENLADKILAEADTGVTADGPLEPPFVAESIFPLGVKYTGASVQSKLEAVAKELETARATFAVLTALDDIAWLLNLRCLADVTFCPVFFANAIVSLPPPAPASEGEGKNQTQTAAIVHLFIQEPKFNAAARAEINALVAQGSVELHPYTSFVPHLHGYLKKGVAAAEADPVGAPFVAAIAESSTPYAVINALTQAKAKSVRLQHGSVVEKLKAIKNQVELDGFINSHIRDGAALTRFMAWANEAVFVDAFLSHGAAAATGASATDDKKKKDVGESWPGGAGAGEGGAKLTEWAAAERLRQFRAEEDDFLCPSFGSIASVNRNAAIVHYHPNPDTAAPLTWDALMLLDSGGQYRDGTTDVTRTFCFTPPSVALPAPLASALAAPERQRRLRQWQTAYTLVLKGHIKLNSTPFPAGTTGSQLDVLARMDLWAAGRNYGHGTGHGVGHCLNVHEGPHGIAQRARATDPGLRPGMVVSNEPGYYDDVHGYGIRIENLDYIVPAPVYCSDLDVAPFGAGEAADGPSVDGLIAAGKSAPAAAEYYRLKSLTMAPLCRDLIDAAALTDAERRWINDYHTTVYGHLQPRLKAHCDARALRYLARHCAPI